MVQVVLEHKLQRLLMVEIIEPMLDHQIQTVQEHNNILKNIMDQLGQQEIIIQLPFLQELLQDL